MTEEMNEKEEVNEETTDGQPPKEQQEKPEEKAGKKEKKDAAKKEIAKLREELEAQKDAYLRLLAEYDNFRRRSAKEREDAYTDAYADAVKQILPIADNLERSLQFADSEQVVQGVRMTYGNFQKALESMGISEIECKTFDPNFHNAVMHVEDEAYGESEILEVFEKGYKKNDKVIRYAMVKVAN